MNLPTIHTAKPVHRKIQLYAIDTLIILCSYLMTQIVMAVTMDLDVKYTAMFIETVTVIAIHIFAAVLFQLNNIIWRYAEGKEYIYLVLVSMMGAILSCTAVIFLFHTGLPNIYVMLSELTVVLLLVLSRIFYREFCSVRKKHGCENGRRLLIIGAGTAACRLLDEINSTPNCGLVPVGFADDGGEIFVLDMGEPVKIDDLAKNMIRLSGLTLGKDIDIRYIGLRHGEKLYEELLMSEEGMNKTSNRKIFIGKKIPMDYDVFNGQLRELKLLVGNPENDPAVIEKKLMEIVPTFKRSPVYDLPASAFAAELEGVGADV